MDARRAPVCSCNAHAFSSPNHHTPLLVGRPGGPPNVKQARRAFFAPMCAHAACMLLTRCLLLAARVCSWLPLDGCRGGKPEARHVHPAVGPPGGQQPRQQRRSRHLAAAAALRGSSRRRAAAAAARLGGAAHPRPHLPARAPSTVRYSGSGIHASCQQQQRRGPLALPAVAYRRRGGDAGPDCPACGPAMCLWGARQAGRQAVPVARQVPPAATACAGRCFQWVGHADGMLSRQWQGWGLGRGLGRGFGGSEVHCAVLLLLLGGGGVRRAL